MSQRELIDPKLRPKHCEHRACMNQAEYLLLPQEDAIAPVLYCAECVVTRERLKKEMS